MVGNVVNPELIVNPETAIPIGVSLLDTSVPVKIPTENLPIGSVVNPTSEEISETSVPESISQVIIPT